MKKYLIFLFVVFFASQAFSQQEEKKDSVDAKAAPVVQDTATAPKPVAAVAKDTASAPAPVAAVATDSAVVAAKTDSVVKDTAAVSAKADSVATDTLAVDSLAMVVDSVAIQDSLTKAASKSKSKKSVAPAAVVGVAAVAATSGKSPVPNDSLTKVNDSLYRYRVLYSAIKEKVLKRDFDPLRMSYIIDSLAARRDSSFSGLASSSTLLRDSLLASRVEIAALNEKIKALIADDTVRDRLINELKQLKVLFDSGILTRTEFDVLKLKVLQKML